MPKSGVKKDLGQALRNRQKRFLHRFIILSPQAALLRGS